jgi:excisionase family DNA binding protein
MSEQRLLSIKDISQQYKIGRSTIYKNVKNGQLTRVKVGRLTRFWRHVVEEWLRSCESKPR